LSSCAGGWKKTFFLRKSVGGDRGTKKKCSLQREKKGNGVRGLIPPGFWRKLCKKRDSGKNNLPFIGSVKRESGRWQVRGRRSPFEKEGKRKKGTPCPY